MSRCTPYLFSNIISILDVHFMKSLNVVASEGYGD